MNSSLLRSALLRFVDSRSGSLMIPFGLAVTVIGGSVGGGN